MTMKRYLLMMVCVSSIAFGIANQEGKENNLHVVVSDNNNLSSQNNAERVFASGTAHTAVSSLNESSLEGTEPPDGLLVENGSIVIDEGLRDVIDYYVSLRGELGDAEIRLLLEQHLLKRAPQASIETLREVFERYLAYLDSHNMEMFDSVSGVEAQLEAIALVRRELLGGDLAEQFYGDEERYMAYSIKKMQLMREETLSEHEKLTQIDELKADLPLEIRQWRQQAQVIKQLRESTQALIETGASNDDLYAYRQSVVGGEAASRLRELDLRRLQWEARYETYRDNVAAIRFSGLSAQDQQHALFRLRERSFEGPEVQRVAALDRMQAIRQTQ